MTNILEMFIEPSVIAVIILGIVSYWSFQKESQLKYITQDRKEWRDKLREIAYHLHGANIHDTMKLLTELKVRINTYGYSTDLVKSCTSKCGLKGKLSYDYSKDEHIWSLIAAMENLCSLEKSNGKCYTDELAKSQEQMILYISLMLKDDWERSKDEVNGKKRTFLYPIFSLVIFLILVSVLLMYKSTGCLAICGVDFLFLLFTILCVMFLIFIERYSFENNEKAKKKRKKNYKRCLEKINTNGNKELNNPN